MEPERRGRRARWSGDRDAKASVVAFASVALSAMLAASVLFALAEQQLPETPTDQKVTGVHFSVEGPDASREVTVSWFTDEFVRAAKLKWGKVGEAPRTVWAQNESWYYLGDVTHYVRVQGLVAGETYQFWPGDEDWGFRGPFNYTVPGAAGQPLRLGVWGNIGSSGEAPKNRDLMRAADVDVVVSLGDLVYGNGDPVKWRDWFVAMEPLFGSRLHTAVLGDKEDESAANPGLGKRAYYGTMRQPENERWFAYRVGDVDLIVLDSENLLQGGTLAAAQMEWLGTHLRVADEDPTLRWKVAFFHHAAFATSISDNGKPLRDKVDSLFHQYGVQLVFMGHEGFYERTHVMETQNNVLTNQSRFVEHMEGTVWWLTAGGGAALGTRGKAQDWLAHGDTVHHHVLVDFHVNGTAHVRGVKSADGKPFDHVWVGLGSIPADAGAPAPPPEDPVDDPADDAPEPPPDESADDPPPAPEDEFAEEPKQEPGFGLVAALVAAAGVLWLRRRRLP